MAKKILSPIGSLLLGKKKKKAGDPAAAAPAAKGPKVTPLGAAGLPLTKKRSPLDVARGTILGLSERLGG